MTDLILSDFRHLTSEGLAKILSDEKRRMFGDQKPKARKQGTNPSSSSVESLRGGRNA